MGFTPWDPERRAPRATRTMIIAPHPRSASGRCLGLARAPWLSLAPWVPSAVAQTEPVLPPPDDLKKLSVDQLLDMVVTSVSKRPEKLLDVASAIQVITGEDISRSGATSIPEALRLASNLEVAQVDSRQWAISARGFNDLFADKMLVLMDGRSVYTPLYGGVYWDAQDTLLQDIDQVEVISGPGATQWGANAVNGVINITTKSAKDTQGGLLFGGGGTEVNEFGGARYGGELAPDVYYRVYAKYTDRGDFETPGGQSAQDSWQTGQTGFRVDWYAAGGNLLTFQGDAYDATMGQIEPDNIRASGGNLSAGGRTSCRRPPTSSSRSTTTRPIGRFPGSFTQDVDTYDSDFQYHCLLGRRERHRLRLWVPEGGRQHRQFLARAGVPSAGPRPEPVQRLCSGRFALVPDRWHLIAGTKVEHNDYTGLRARAERARSRGRPTRPRPCGRPFRAPSARPTAPTSTSTSRPPRRTRSRAARTWFPRN